MSIMFRLFTHYFKNCCCFGSVLSYHTMKLGNSLVKTDQPID